jgi:hypothetical protein
VRPLGRCEVTLKEICGVVYVREVVKSPRIMTVHQDSLLWLICVRGFFVFELEGKSFRWEGGCGFFSCLHFFIVMVFSLTFCALIFVLLMIEMRKKV